MGANGASAVFGKAIFNILSNNSNVLAVSGMSANKIQPEPLIGQGDPAVAITYEINAVTPTYTKTNFGNILHGVPAVTDIDFSVIVYNRDYSTGCALANLVIDALVDALTSGTYNGIRVNGISLESSSEDYNRQRKYYTNSLSFRARML